MTVLLQETLEKEAAGQSTGVARLNNMLMQMRKNANHPDLITSHFEQAIEYPPPEQLVAECGKMQLLERLLQKLHKGGHKVTSATWPFTACCVLPFAQV